MDGNTIAALIFGVAMVSFFGGMLAQYLCGEPKCKHKYEEIANDLIGKKHVVVYMCKSCGKRKVTKVK